jgi:MFS family permease
MPLLLRGCLQDAKSGLVQSAFYCGYFFGALPAARAVQRVGYKKTVILVRNVYIIHILTGSPEVPPFLISLQPTSPIAQAPCSSDALQHGDALPFD